MVELIKRHIRNGQTVKIFTARADETEPNHKAAIRAIQDWCEIHLGKRLEVTNKKDRHMWLLYDDRAVQVEPNTGRIIKDTLSAVNLNSEIRRIAEECETEYNQRND